MIYQIVADSSCCLFVMINQIAANQTIFIHDNEAGLMKIQTHVVARRACRDFPLEDIADLISACFPDATPTQLGNYSVRLPDGTARNALEDDCFSSRDPADTTLRKGLRLVLLERLNSDRKPLILNSKVDIAESNRYFNTEAIGIIKFSIQHEVLMTASELQQWLCGSHTSFGNDIDELLLCQEDVNSTPEIVFPLSGREDSLKHIANCFSTCFKQRSNKDRNSRPIPVCTGIPGLGKTRLLEECASTVFNLTGIQGERLSAIISFGTDGDSYGPMDEHLGIQCSLAWRVLHVFFKAHWKYATWMQQRSPSNRKQMTLELALEVVELHRRPGSNGNILTFIGLDEYQRLGQKDLKLLLDALCDSSRRPSSSKLSVFYMLAGTDLNMTRIARSSHPNTERTPIRFLSHKESMDAIGGFISRTYPGFT
jgi:hypothetical protein